MSQNTMTNGQAFSIKKAHRTQLQMSKKIVFKDVLPKDIRLVAGVDVAYQDDVSIGAVAVLDYDSLEVVESQTASCSTRLPYIATLLSFREIRPMVLGIRKLRAKPDVFLVDGQGFAHPYRCGLASHLGLAIGKPTIGVAKNKLFGAIEATKRGEPSLLKHKNEIIGALVSTESRRKPVYVSVGHMITLETAIGIVRRCFRSNRIPEPLLKAHQIATTERRKSRSCEQIVR